MELISVELYHLCDNLRDNLSPASRYRSLDIDSFPSQDSSVAPPSEDKEVFSVKFKESLVEDQAKSFIITEKSFHCHIRAKLGRNPSPSQKHTHHHHHHHNHHPHLQVRRQLEQNNTELLDSMISNISDTLIQRDKASRLRFYTNHNHATGCL